LYIKHSCGFCNLALTVLNPHAKHNGDSDQCISNWYTSLTGMVTSYVETAF